MKKLLIILMALFFIGASASAVAADLVARSDFDKYAPGFTGTFILYDEERDQYTVFNQEQSTVRLSPCSTFKIYNSLIGLEIGVLAREDTRTLFPWDGQRRFVPAWNCDHTLSSATRESVVWYFQELAARIGEKRMREYL